MFMRRICFVGFGSIGKMYIKNLVYFLNHKEQDYELML